LPEGVASRLGLKAEALGPVLEAMGFRLLPAEPLEEGQFGPPIPARIAPVRHERRAPRIERPAPPPPPPRWDPAVMFGPPVPREFRPPRPDRPPRREAERPPPPPRQETTAAPVAERPRFERPRAPANGEAPAPRRDDRGPRPDRPRFDGPRRDRDRDRDQDRAPREYQSGPKADSPFAVLAQLKLKKD
jgi:ATP-dependent RNA helicase SUPV3L1/SUV3